MTGRGVGSVVQSDNALGQRAGLVGAEYVHAAEVLDRIEAADDDPLPGHCAGARAAASR